MMNQHSSDDAKALRPGPIRHHSLSDELLAQIQAAYSAIGRYLAMNLEEFEIGFNNLKDKILECELIRPHFRVTYHAFSSEQLDKALEVANDIKTLVAKIR